MCKLQEVLQCCWEIQDCRNWGKRDTSFWPIQTEMDWWEELQRVIATPSQKYSQDKQQIGQSSKTKIEMEKPKC